MSSAAVENYNQLVPQQRDLSQTIKDSTNVILAALENKLQLAKQQKQLQAELGIHYPDLSPEDVRRQVVDTIVRRLQGQGSTGLIDWSCRVAGPGGNLEE